MLSELIENFRMLGIETDKIEPTYFILLKKLKKFIIWLKKYVSVTNRHPLFLEHKFFQFYTQIHFYNLLYLFYK